MKNILMISIDDLNDWTAGLQGYAGQVHTPNLDALMSTGSNFVNAFSSAAICNPSRTSIMTGRSPIDTGIFQNQADWEAVVDPGETIFGLLKSAGYETISIGKILHTGPSPAAMPQMFDRYDFMGIPHPTASFDGFAVGPVPDGTVMPDQVRAEEAVRIIQGLQAGDPVFLSVGFDKPHYPWSVPQEYFDLYPLEDIVLEQGSESYEELSAFLRENIGQTDPFDAADIPDEATARKLIQGYLAAISYMDAQLGKVVRAIDGSAVASDTVLVAWSDHGYHLGDRDFWHKFTLWDNAAKAPLIIKDLGAPQGQVIQDVVELREIFPTLLDIAGVTNPVAGTGSSLMPYVESGSRNGAHEAVTWMYGSVSLRTNQYRFTLYEDGTKELFDVVADPELTDNLIGDPGSSAIAQQLESYLRGHESLYGYSDSLRQVSGSGGNDVLASHLDGATLSGGLGDDSYFTRPGAVIVESADGGHDRVTLKASKYALAPHVEDVEVVGFSQEVLGNELDNKIVATAFSVKGLAGNDFIVSYRTGATVRGGSGDDAVMNRGRQTVVYGEAGNDSITGSQYADVLGGSEGRDVVHGSFGADSLYGGQGDDSLDGAHDNDQLFGGLGNDTLLGDVGNDRIEGEAGDDLLGGGIGNDALKGGAGRDFLYGGQGNDRLDAGQDNDQLFGGLGNDTLLGDVGNDRIEGEAGDDLLGGGIGNDALKGGAGRDFLYGMEGNDSLDGGQDNDQAFGGIGNDTLLGDAGDDRIEGEFGDDLLGGGIGNDALKGDAGRDFLYGGQGNDRLDAGQDNDQLFGGLGNDSLKGDEGHDRLEGEAGDDFLRGGIGRDTLKGDAGRDFLYGGLGADWLHGGMDRDADLFVFTSTAEIGSGANADTIFGFFSGTDRVDLGDVDANLSMRGDQDFLFSAMGARKNSVWFTVDRFGVLIRGDNNGDAVHDFELRISDIGGMSKGDVIL